MTKQATLLFLRALIIGVLINLCLRFSAEPDTTAFQMIISSESVPGQTVHGE